MSTFLSTLKSASPFLSAVIFFDTFFPLLGDPNLYVSVEQKQICGWCLSFLFLKPNLSDPLSNPINMRLHPASQSTHVFPTLVAKALDAATWESFIFQVDADDDFDDDAHCWCWWWWWWSAQAPGHLLPDRLWLWFSRAQDRGHPPHHHHHHLHPHFDLKVKSISFYTFSSLQFHWLGYSPQKSCFVVVDCPTQL